MQALARVLFHVQARDADALFFAANLDIYMAVLGERLVILRDLVALRQVGIKIVFPRKDGNFIDTALQSHCRQGREFHRLPVQHRQSSRESQAYRAHIGVWRIAKARRTRAKDFRSGQQLYVDFESDDRLVFRE